MTKGFACAAALAVASLPAPLPAAAQGEQGKAVTPTTLTDADRAEIQKLTSGYNEFIGTCKPESYAKLFESQRGYFESLSRGRVWGQEALVGQRGDRRSELVAGLADLFLAGRVAGRTRRFFQRR